MNSNEFLQYDTVGIGIGPSNLSVAALLESLPGQHNRFYERRPAFQWHPGLLFPSSTITVSYLKDLVTLADPTHRLSFLAFLAAQKRLYQFINADFQRVSRLEYNQYLQWVCGSLNNLVFDREVQEVQLEGKTIVVQLGGERVYTKNIVLGSGLHPAVPDCAAGHQGTSIFHGSQYLNHARQMEGSRVVVVGGGQTGAEIVDHILADSCHLPAELTWVTRRSNFLPLEESPFTNELFTPSFSNYFFHLDPATRERLLAEQKLSSDGISPPLLERLYQRFYNLKFIEKWNNLRLLPACELEGVESVPSRHHLTIREQHRDEVHHLYADIIILCTGFEFRIPDYLEPIAERLHLDRGGYSVREDFSIDWDGPPGLRIYVQNAARHSHGIADPNLSLLAWRGATIVNSLSGSEVYDLRGTETFIERLWNEPEQICTDGAAYESI